jgi:hypothetical protein
VTVPVLLVMTQARSLDCIISAQRVAARLLMLPAFTLTAVRRVDCTQHSRESTQAGD